MNKSRAGLVTRVGRVVHYQITTRLHVSRNSWPKCNLNPWSQHEGYPAAHLLLLPENIRNWRSKIILCRGNGIWQQNTGNCAVRNFYCLSCSERYKKWLVSPFLQATKALRESRGIALLCFIDLGTRSGWRFSVTPRPLSTPGKDPVSIVQEAGWTPAPVWTGAGNLAPTGIRSPDRLARSITKHMWNFLWKYKWTLRSKF
jgi:hypothetical protein